MDNNSDLDLLVDALLERGGAPVVAATALVVATLGEQVALVAAAGQRRTDERFRLSVALRGVDHVEPGVQRLAEHPRDGAGVGPLEADLGAAEAEHADAQSRAAERAALYCGRLRRRGAAPARAV